MSEEPCDWEEKDKSDRRFQLFQNLIAHFALSCKHIGDKLVAKTALDNVPPKVEWL